MDLLETIPVETDIAEMRDGMLMDATLQAILRGHGRMGAYGECGECHVVVVQTHQKGLTAEQYRRMFPGVVLTRDRTLAPERQLKGRMKQLGELVQKRLADGETELSNPSLYEALRMTKGYFGRLVTKPEWKAFIVQLGLSPQMLPGRMAGLRLVR